MSIPIEKLDDATALRLFAIIAKYELDSGATEQRLTSEQLTVLQDEFGTVETATPVSDGDIARAALMLLAEDPKLRQKIEALAQGGAPDSFSAELLTDAAIVTAAITVLKTGVDVKKDKDGKWTLHLYTRPLDNKILSTFVQKLLGWWPGKPSE